MEVPPKKEVEASPKGCSSGMEGMGLAAKGAGQDSLRGSQQQRTPSTARGLAVPVLPLGHVLVKQTSTNQHACLCSWRRCCPAGPPCSAGSQRWHPAGAHAWACLHTHSGGRAAVVGKGWRGSGRMPRGAVKCHPTNKNAGVAGRREAQLQLDLTRCLALVLCRRCCRLCCCRRLQVLQAWAGQWVGSGEWEHSQGHICFRGRKSETRTDSHSKPNVCLENGLSVSSTCLLVKRIQLEVAGGHKALAAARVAHQHPAIGLLKQLNLWSRGMDRVEHSWCHDPTTLHPILPATLNAGRTDSRPVTPGLIVAAHKQASWPTHRSLVGNHPPSCLRTLSPSNTLSSSGWL